MSSEPTTRPPSETTLPIGGKTLVLRQSSRYPWEGAVRIDVEPEAKTEFALFIRIPGWAGNEAVPGGLYRFLGEPAARPSLRINGRAVALDLERGYAKVRRAWTRGDVVELSLPMEVRRVTAVEDVVEDLDKVALQRGPLVYCVEAVDNGGKVLDLALPDAAALTAELKPDLLNGVVVISGRALRLGAGEGEPGSETPFAAIPYYAWANRGDGEMAVWILRSGRSR